MNKSTIVKVIAAAVVLTAAFFVYRMVFVTGRESPEAGLVPQSASAPRIPVAADDEFIRSLRRLQEIGLDTGVFGHPVWVSLRSFSQPIPSEEVGRANPFAPIGFEIFDEADEPEADEEEASEENNQPEASD